MGKRYFQVYSSAGYRCVRCGLPAGVNICIGEEAVALEQVMLCHGCVQQLRDKLTRWLRTQRTRRTKRKAGGDDA